MMLVERLSSEAFKPRKNLEYYDVNRLHPLYDKLAFKANALLVGPKGVGKSLSIAAFCADREIPVITFDCSEDVRRSHLIGMFVPRGKEVPFILGPLTTAFEVANECGKCVLILEEINSLSPQMQKILNGISDFRKSIEVPEAQRVFRLNDGADLWVTGTMNTAGYAGVYAINEDLKSRFRFIPVEYPDKTAEKKILEAILKARSLTVEDTIVGKALTLAKETRQKAMEYALSTRDLVQFLEDYTTLGLERALWLLSGKFDGLDRTTIQTRMESIFGVGKVLLK